MATTSPEPCQGTAETCAFSPRQMSFAGRKWVRPAFSESDAVSMASINGNGRGSVPERTSIAGRTKRSKVTIVETGLPGNPKTDLRSERNRIAIANLKRAGGQGKIHNLITGRKNRNARLACDDRTGRSNLSCRGDFRKSDSLTG